MESVDYVDTFITVAPDSAAVTATVPPERASGPTVASATFAMIAERLYGVRSSEVIFTVWADRRSIPADQREQAWAEFYAKGQACLRASDLAKRYGWGIHADHDGRLALYGVDTPEYAALAAGSGPDGRPVTVTAAMRSKR